MNFFRAALPQQLCGVVAQQDQESITLDEMQECATTLSITTFSITTFSIMTLSIMRLVTTLSINDTQHK